jgi:hypothetical protein
LYRVLPQEEALPLPERRPGMYGGSQLLPRQHGADLPGRKLSTEATMLGALRWVL